MIFAVFDVHVAVNKCINWCFVHLYLLFYYQNNVFSYVVSYNFSVLHGYKNVKS